MVLVCAAVVTTSTPERQEGIACLKEALENIEEAIRASGGNFSVKMAVRVSVFLSET